MKTLPIDLLRDAILKLMEETYVAPPDPGETWFTDNEPDAGILGTIRGLDADTANTPVGDGTTVASHVGHLVYALGLFNRLLRGENPYADADWKGSWSARPLTDSEWSRLIQSLEDEYSRAREALSDHAPSPVAWENPDVLTDIFAALAHGAWHLGSIRKTIEVAAER